MRDKTDFPETVKNFCGEIKPRLVDRRGEWHGRRWPRLRLCVILSSAIGLGFGNNFERRFWRVFPHGNGRSCGRGCVARSQEFLRLKRDCAWVGPSFPQASAIVSKTFSC